MTKHEWGMLIALCVGSMAWFGAYSMSAKVRWIFLGGVLIGGSLVIAVVFPGWVLDYNYVDWLEAFFLAGLIVPAVLRFLYWVYIQQSTNVPVQAEVKDSPEQIAP